MKNIKLRLIVMNFLEFAVWGAYLTCMGNYLGKAGMGGEISWFYAIQGIVSIFMPTIMGIVADKWIQPQRLLGICHLIAGAAMIGLFMMGCNAAQPDKAAFITLYTLSVAFYMPTLALSNTTAFTILKDSGMASSTRIPASETRCFCPPLRAPGTEPSSCSTLTVRAASRTFRFISSWGIWSFSSAKAMSSATVRPMNCPSVSCRTVPTCLDILKMPSAAGFRPFTLSEPSILPGKVEGMRAFMHLAIVDLPEPDAPTMRTFSPLRIEKLMFLSVGPACVL